MAQAPVLFLGGQRLDLVAWLRTQETTVDHVVVVGVHEQLRARLIALCVPPEVANQRRFRLRQDAQRHGRTPSADSLARCAWTLYLTNVDAALVSGPEILVLARARWQVERLFRLWKSHGQIDTWRSRDPWHSLTTVMAKLLAMLIHHWALLMGTWAAAHRSLDKAAQTIREHALCLLYALTDTAALTHVLMTLAATLAAGCRLNTRKTHPNTSQLLLEPSLVGLT